MKKSRGQSLYHYIVWANWATLLFFLGHTRQASIISSLIISLYIANYKPFQINKTHKNTHTHTHTHTHTINFFSKLNSFQVNDSSHSSLKHKRTSGSLTFSVDTETRYWLEMDYRLLIRCLTEVTLTVKK